MSLTKLILLVATVGYFACNSPQAKMNGDATSDKTNGTTLAEVKEEKPDEKPVKPGHDKQPITVTQAKDHAEVEADIPADLYDKKAAKNQPDANKSVRKTEQKATAVPVKTKTESSAKEEMTKEAEKSNESVVEKPAPTPQPEGVSHEAWNKLLQQSVSSSGAVNYKAIKSNVTALDAYLDELARNPVQSSWSRNEQMAYWINAYNAFTVKLIVKNYPVKSIMDLHGGKPWDEKWIQLGDKTYSLNEIENDILRPKYKDARIHFAVNCAAQSCPPLLNKAFTAANLSSTLDSQARKFINDSKFNQISAGEAKISKIFEWYAGDFGNIVAYLNKYSTTKINAGAKVSYNEYNWALNN